MHAARRQTTPSLSRPGARARRGTALVALGAAALVTAAPAAVATAADDSTATAPDGTAVEDVALPAVEQVDQLVTTPLPAEEPLASPVVDDVAAEQPVVGATDEDAVVAPAEASPEQAVSPEAQAPATQDEPTGAVVPEAPADAVVAEEPTDAVVAEEPTDELAPDAADTPTPEIPLPFDPCQMFGCFGTGKLSVGVVSGSGANLAGAVIELDVAGTSPEPEFTTTTDDGGYASGWNLPNGVSATVRVVSVPEGSMLVGSGEQTFGPCTVPVNTFTWCNYTFQAEVVQAYRVLDVVVQDESGRPVAGADVELWGTPAAPPAPVLLRAAPAPAGLTLLGTATSDTAGRLSFGQVAPGSYELRVIAVPAGYILPATTIPLSVAAVATAAQAQLTVPVTLAAPAAPTAPVVLTPPPAVVTPVSAVVTAPAAAATRPADAAELAATGVEPTGLAALAAALLGLGVIAAFAGRRAGRRS